jgi:hypothetical protein
VLKRFGSCFGSLTRWVRVDGCGGGGVGRGGHCDGWTLREPTVPICIGLLLDS